MTPDPLSDAETLRQRAATFGHGASHDACLAGAAALDEAAPLRAERDKFRLEHANVEFLCKQALRKVNDQDAELVALLAERDRLRARVQHLAEALAGMLELAAWKLDHGHWATDEQVQDVLIKAQAALTPPASTEGSNG